MCRDKGLRFNYDEKYHHSHKCASKVFLLIGEEEDEAPMDPPFMDPQPDPLDDASLSQAQISLHTLSGHLVPETLRLVGRVTQREVVILVDRGSTYNFMQEHLVHTLDLHSRPTTTWRVMVGNDHEIECHRLCKKVSLHVQGHMFAIDFHVLPLCGADLVLGVQWLKTLGPILTDYNDLTMKFLYVGQIVELKGDSELELRSITPPQLHRMIRKQGASGFFHIRVLLADTHTDLSSITPNLPDTIPEYFPSSLNTPLSLPDPPFFFLPDPPTTISICFLVQN